MPEDTYGSGGGAQGGVSNLAGGQGGAPVGGAPENSTSGALNPFAGQSGAGNPNMISSSNFGAGGGDIVLNNNGKKTKRIGLVVGTVAFLAVLLVVGLTVAMKMTGGMGGVSKKYEALVQYIENGTGFESSDNTEEEDVEAEVSSEEWIYAIRVSSEGASVVSEYYAGLEKRENEFLASFKGNDELLGEYKFALQVLKNAINYEAVADKIIEIYVSDGTEGVEKYFEENLSCEISDSSLSGICSAEQNYYDAVLKEYMFYTDIGCNKDNYYDILCAEKHYIEGEFLNRINSLESGGYHLRIFSSDATKSILSREIVELSNLILEGL